MNRKLVVAAFAALTLAAGGAPAAAHGYRHASGPSYGFSTGRGQYGYGWGGDYAYADLGPPWIGVNLGVGPLGWGYDWGNGYRSRGGRGYGLPYYIRRGATHGGTTTRASFNERAGSSYGRARGEFSGGPSANDRGGKRGMR